MSPGVLFLVLAGAFLHALWNVIVKGGSEKLYELGINALGAGLCAFMLVFFVPLPQGESIWILPLSALFHFLYYLSMAGAYRVADLTLCYTVMRGSAPMLTALALLACGSNLPLSGWAGISLLCAGIFCLALQAARLAGSQSRGIIYALRTALAITAYTLADGFGARLSGNGFSYCVWLFILNIAPINAWLLLKSDSSYVAYLRKRVRIGLAGGLASFLSYGIAIWAMTVAPIALVAGLRETSVIFAMLLAVLFLRERLTPLRVSAVALVAAGAVLARLG